MSSLKSYLNFTNAFVNIIKLRLHAYAAYSDFTAVENDDIQLNNFDIFLILAQNIDCG